MDPFLLFGCELPEAKVILAFMLLWNVSAETLPAIPKPAVPAGVMDVHRAYMNLTPEERFHYEDYLRNIGFRTGNLMTAKEHRSLRFKQGCANALSILLGGETRSLEGMGSPKFTVTGDINPATAGLLVRAMTEKRSVRSLMDEAIQNSIDHDLIPAQAFVTLVEADSLLFGRDIMGNQGDHLNRTFEQVTKLVNQHYTALTMSRPALGRSVPLFLAPLGDGGGRGHHSATVRIMQQNRPPRDLRLEHGSRDGISLEQAYANQILAALLDKGVVAQAIVDHYLPGQQWGSLHPRVLEGLGEEKACRYQPAQDGECDLIYEFVSLNQAGTKLFLTIGNDRAAKKLEVVRIEDGLTLSGRQTGTVVYHAADGTRLIRKVYRNGVQELEFKLP